MIVVAARRPGLPSSFVGISVMRHDVVRKLGRHAHGVLQSSANDFSRIDDAGFDHVAVGIFAGVGAFTPSF